MCGGTAASSQPGPGRPVGGRAPGHAGAVLADAPQPGLGHRVGHDERVDAEPGARPAPRRAPSTSSRSSPASSTNSHASPRGSGGTAPSPRRARSTDSSRESRPSHEVGPCATTAGEASPAATMSSKPSTTTTRTGASTTSSHRRLGDHAEGALGADEAPGSGRSARAAGAARRSPTPGGRTGRARCARWPGGRAITVAHAGQHARRRRPRRGGRRRRTTSRRVVAGRGQEPQPGDVVGGAAVGQRARAAGVVADHPADRAARVGRRVGPEADAVRRDGLLQHGVDGAGLDDGGARLGVDRQHPVEVAREVERRCRGPTALPATEVPAPREVSGTPVSRATASAAATSSTERGRTTASGGIR